MTRDPDLRDAFRARFIEPRQARMRQLFARAQARGEMRADIDVDLLCDIVPAHAFYRIFTCHIAIDADEVVRLIDGLVLPAALCDRSHTADRACTEPTGTTDRSVAAGPTTPPDIR